MSEILSSAIPATGHADATDDDYRTVYRSASVILGNWPGKPINCDVIVDHFTTPDQLDELATELGNAAQEWRAELAAGQPANGPLNEPINAELRALIAQQGIKHADLARQLGIDRRTLDGRLHGRTDWPLPEFLAVCDALGVRPFELAAV